MAALERHQVPGMRPLTFINGVILGSAGALGSVLAIIIFFRWVLTLDDTLNQTVVRSDLPLGDLLQYMVIFQGVTVVAFAGFWGELKLKPWRSVANFVLAVTVSGVLVYFFAEPETRLRDMAWLGAATVVAGVLLTLAVRVGLAARLSRWLGD